MPVDIAEFLRVNAGVVSIPAAINGLLDVANNFCIGHNGKAGGLTMNATYG